LRRGVDRARIERRRAVVARVLAALACLPLAIVRLGRWRR
jgi:hypothetical protein